jgi:hypothetical protein
MTLHLLHAPEPVQVQLAGNSLQAGWMPHCCCSWRDPDHLCDDREAAVNWTLEHMARIPELWQPPAA